MKILCDYALTYLRMLFIWMDCESEFADRPAVWILSPLRHDLARFVRRLAARVRAFWSALWHVRVMLCFAVTTVHLLHTQFAIGLCTPTRWVSYMYTTTLEDTPCVLRGPIFEGMPRHRAGKLHSS